MKAGHALGKFSSLYRLEFSHLLFSAAEQVSLTLQTKNIGLHDQLLKLLKAFSKDRSTSFMKRSYRKHSIEEPQLPRRRRRPARYESGGTGHVFTSPKILLSKDLFEACDMLHEELELGPEQTFEHSNVRLVTSHSYSLKA